MVFNSFGMCVRYLIIFLICHVCTSYTNNRHCIKYKAILDEFKVMVSNDPNFNHPYVHNFNSRIYKCISD